MKIVKQFKRSDSCSGHHLFVAQSIQVLFFFERRAPNLLPQRACNFESMVSKTSLDTSVRKMETPTFWSVLQAFPSCPFDGRRNGCMH